ncbi:glycosyl transferase, family 19 [Nitrobacter sp. Nb-311A]|uniref:lipid-A-disaccharide synthase n=1 Tax=unclassified Nitrobacter TaxID=2620411 RepID=UPI0000684AE1|nr:MULTISPECIES: lipid-A-disaccharide synthase [unclassified Nitrobacter]EAQ34080.1 glycosyl transferase, family 19 [Nitrobacter sp. Nb-311A]MCB1392356.1 lipid-A-disaccharide synthase [Nitrobacter sp.]MCV0386210.1 lipid-A-disaccharide synthase [Nitrobacter sp.]
MPEEASTNLPLKIFLIATEESGDRLGSSLMKALRRRLGGGDSVRFEGVGGQSMAREGLVSLFPSDELSIMGFAAVVKRLPMIIRRIHETADAVIASAPDMLVIIDSPDFTHRVARRVRARRRGLPIVDYVSPSVWAWRPGRARAMLGYVDHVLALLPFEPEAYCRLGGPPCTYVGHPLIEQVELLRPDARERQRRDASPPTLLVLPGSRRSEIRHHLSVFGETIEVLKQSNPDIDVILPTTPHLVDEVTAALARLPGRARIVVGEDDKRAAFRVARAALAKSGTVTLELALAGVPMVAAYKAGRVEAWIAQRVIRASSVILANLVIGENVIPEFLQDDCVPDKLATALREVLTDSPMRQRQLAAFARLDAIMATGQRSPSERAADIVIEVMRESRRTDLGEQRI